MTKIYMDNNATTRLHPFLINKMSKYFLNNYANPSASHSSGKLANKGLEDSRKIIAKKLHCCANEIVFTSGATESNNFILRGFMKAHPQKNHIITSDIEHASVFETCKDLNGSCKCKISYIPVKKNGIIDLKKLEAAITPKTGIISVMLANNEIGTIQPIKKIVQIAKKYGIPVHTDATQYLGKWKVNVKELGVDSLSASSHKFHGPNGIGFVYIHEGLGIAKYLTGGLSKEQSMRSSTPDVPGVVGMAQAIKYNLADCRYEKNYKKVQQMRDFIENEIKKGIPGVRINGDPEKRMINTLSVSFPNVKSSKRLMLDLDRKGIIVNTGSACSAHKKSRILEHIGLPDNYINGTLRISLSEYNTMKECRYLVYVLKRMFNS